MAEGSHKLPALTTESPDDETSGRKSHLESINGISIVGGDGRAMGQCRTLYVQSDATLGAKDGVPVTTLAAAALTREGYKVP